MPLYDYACTVCGRRVEVLQSVHAREPEHCEVCGGRLRRVISSPAVHFKGTGWAKKERAAAATKRARSSAGDGDSASGKAEARDDSSSGTKSGGTKSGGGESGRGESGGNASGADRAGADGGTAARERSGKASVDERAGG
ncbi:MAG: FmdB family zinc ribbon protein [Candidatus Limnocylindrales bacterium]